MDEFLKGFAVGAGIDDEDADDKWATFSRRMTFAQKLGIERGGKPAGVREGKMFARLYPGGEVEV